MIQRISFTSTYRIPLSEQGITPHKKEMLKEFADNYPNHLYRNNRLGHVRISVPQALDKEVEAGLKELGFKVYQKFDIHDVSKKDMDQFIKQALYDRDYSQFGKQKRRAKHHFKRKFAA